MLPSASRSSNGVTSGAPNALMSSHTLRPLTQKLRGDHLGELMHRKIVRALEATKESQLLLVHRIFEELRLDVVS